MQYSNGDQYKKKLSGKSKTLKPQTNDLNCLPCAYLTNVTKPAVVQCYANTQWLGAALIQEVEPVVHVSRSLTKCQRHYALIAIACRKLNQYIYWYSYVTIHSDHVTPLEAIVRTSLPDAPKRLQRMMLSLQRYNLRVVYKPGTEQLIADMSSRPPVQEMSKDLIFQCSIQDNLAEEIDSVDKYALTSASPETHKFDKR